MMKNRNTIALQRFHWIVSTIAGIVALLLTRNTPFAVVVVLASACVLNQIPPSWLVSVGLLFLCATAGLAVLDQTGWINQNPQITLASAEVGLVDLHAAMNQAAIYACEMFFAGTIGYVVQQAREKNQSYP